MEAIAINLPSLSRSLKDLYNFSLPELFYGFEQFSKGQVLDDISKQDLRAQRQRVYDWPIDFWLSVNSDKYFVHQPLAATQHESNFGIHCRFE
tara:strand:- start:419 stop:697 length:279 start_codon:yes stop_codon:yes gene_type:complete